MTPIHFYKYQAAGNDFVLADNREGKFSFTTSQIEKLCDRRFGIGADGLICLDKDPKQDFKMVYYNSDGSEGFCGNGCRAIVHLANRLGVIQKHARFSAYDGDHHADIVSEGMVKQSLIDVSIIEQKGEDYFINTGTEHNIRFVKNLADYPVFEEGRKIRYSDSYKPRGTNADFVEVHDDQNVSFRIYERGVEAETWSSGSGATACALAVAKKYGRPSPIKLKARGGTLEVEFKMRQDGTFHDIYLTGPVQLVFETTQEI
ncbi:MAG TPA: diaminopimelate epimerase [Cyclobacteriaceae bacterium]|nr:diaminopimelate epimerase [Cyclobacteriaceae bacterium]